MRADFMYRVSSAWKTCTDMEGVSNMEHITQVATTSLSLNREDASMLSHHPLAHLFATWKFADIFFPCDDAITSWCWILGSCKRWCQTANRPRQIRSHSVRPCTSWWCELPLRGIHSVPLNGEMGIELCCRNTWSWFSQGSVRSFCGRRRQPME